MHLDPSLCFLRPAGGGAQVRVLVPEADGVHGQRGRGPRAPHLPIQRAVYLGPPGERRGLTARRAASQ